MNKKYFAASNTYYMKNFIDITDVKYIYSMKSLNDPGYSKLYYNYELTGEFFKHVHFYELYFNDKGSPVKLHWLSEIKDDVEFPNGWIDFNNYLSEIEYNKWFVYNCPEKGIYFDSNEELYKAILRWAKDQVERQIKDKIVDSVENEEFKK